MRKLAKTNNGRAALRALAGAGGEGTEEVISDLLDPFAKLIYNDQALKEAWENRKDLASDMLYDYLIGFAMGGLGAGGSIITGQDAAKNKAARKADSESYELFEEQQNALEQIQNQTRARELDDLDFILGLATQEEVKASKAVQKNEKAFSDAGIDGEYTVQRGDDGSVVININSDILAGKPQSEWAKTVRQKIQQVFKNGLSLPRGQVFSNKKGRGEFSNGSYTRMLERSDPELYKAKMRMTPGTGAMVENAENIQFETPAHNRGDDIVGFNRGNIKVVVNGAGYSGDVLTAIYSDGKETFFDVNNLAREKNEASSERYTADKGSFSQTDEASSLEALASNDSIPTSGQNVNRENVGSGNDGYAEFAEQYGIIPTGEKPFRESAVPQSTTGRDRVSRTARTIYEAGATPEARLPSLESAVVDKKFSYIPVANKDLESKARKKIEDTGWQESLMDWTAEVRSGKSNPRLVAMGATLLNNAGNSGMSAEQYIDLAMDYDMLVHNSASATQAARILKNLSPEAKLYGLQRSAKKISEDLTEKARKEVDIFIITAVLSNSVRFLIPLYNIFLYNSKKEG